MKKLKTRCTWDPKEKEEMQGSGKSQPHSNELEVQVLRKVGVLRTDFCGEILAAIGAGEDDSALRRIHALFV